LIVFILDQKKLSLLKTLEVPLLIGL